MLNIAYIDPSVMTYSIQAIAGIAVAIGAVATVFWRRAKKKVSDKLGLDEVSKKEVEEDIVLIEETEETAAEAVEEVTAAE